MRTEPNASTPESGPRKQLSFCRLCPASCGTELTLDDKGRIVGIAADRDHVLTAGYACFKGLHAHEFHNSPDRLLRPMARGADNAYRPIAPDTALDAVAERIRGIIDAHGPGSVACFIGTAGYMNATAYAMTPAWMKAIGSPSIFSSLTIDQSAKLVTAGRLGSWEAGRQSLEDADVWMFVGTNPLVSISSSAGLPPYNGQSRLKAARQRGMRLIVVDPRRTETAAQADLHLQPYPGQDAILMAGLLRLILERGGEDRDFCARHVAGLERLREAVDPFRLEPVAARSGVPAGQILAACDLWLSAKSGCAGTGTGTCMSPASNLGDHMVELLNVVGGRFKREGERVRNPGILDAPAPKRAQVVPPARWWESGHRSRIRSVGTFPAMYSMEMAAGILADEILTPGPGRIRALITVGGNPVLAIPDQAKVVAAMNSLDLAVTIDPFMSATARLSDYVFAPKMMYERADFPMVYGHSRRTPIPFAHYTPPVAAPPVGSELVDDWYVLWALASRLGLPIDFAGRRLAIDQPPTSRDLLELMIGNPSVSLADLEDYPRGRQFDLEAQYVEPAEPGRTTRFDVIPPDVADALAAQSRLLGTPAIDPAEPNGFILSSRRMRDSLNSLHAQAPSIHSRIPTNPLFINPADAGRLGSQDGDRVRITSDHGAIEGVLRADSSVRAGVVQMSHCFGGLPGDDQPGACTNLLVSTDRDVEQVNAMPRQSGIPVTVQPL